MDGRWRWTYLAVVAVVFWLMPSTARAGTLTNVRDYLGRQQASLASGETHQVFFSPATSLPGSANTVVLQFPDLDDGQWCRTAGNDLVVTGITDPEGATESATPLPGTLSADCAQGAGAGSVDTLTVSGVGPLTAGTVYGWSLAEGSVATLGTPAAAQSIVVILSTTDGATTIDTKIFFISIISPDQVTVSAVVSSFVPPAPTNPTVIFNGYAAPQAALTIERDGVQIATGTADDQAKFTFTLSDQPAGSVIYDIRGTDHDGGSLSPVALAFTLVMNTTTEVNGVFLGPSIAINPTAVKIGTPVLISGVTAPAATLTLTIHSLRASSFSVTPDSLGRWSKSVSTSTLTTGTHTAEAVAVVDGTTVSETSARVSFAVSPVSSVGPVAGKLSADINGDGRVNLIDFSILLYYFHQTNPANPRVDINSDGRVDLIDFSILFFEWTG